MIDTATLARAIETDGFAVVPDVLTRAQADEALAHLWAAADESERRGMPTRMESLDPNEANVRVFNLPGFDPYFGELLAHPVAETLAELVLGPDWIVSNFTANVARPGSGSMTLHSDQALVIPEPWLEPWAVNLIWCLTDVRPDNGATRFLPGSHRCRRRAELPPDPLSRLRAFEAPAGSIVVMEGRLWHTSGANVTADEDRALLFAYLTRPFVRPQWNWSAALSSTQQAAYGPVMRKRLGLDPEANLGTVDLRPS